ncbi:MAG: RDD family protein [Pseudomonadota bacterium]
MTIPYANLPDPDRQAGFYAEVPMKRLIAFFIDLLFIALISVLVAFATFGLALFLFAGVFAIVGYIYRVLTLAGGSATWGMRVVGIELRRHDGGRFTLGDAVLHTLAFYVSFGIFPVQFLSAVLMLTTPRGQGLSDFLFGTVALNRRAHS